MARGIRNQEKEEQRKYEAFKLRAEGYTFTQIAEKMKVNVGTVHKLVKMRLAEVQKEGKFVTEEYIALELEASYAGIQACLEMIDSLAPHLMRGKKRIIPNIEVFREVRAWRTEVREWRKHIADVTGVKSSNINHDFNIDAVAKKLKEGMKQMDESAGC